MLPCSHTSGVRYPNHLLGEVTALLQAAEQNAASARTQTQLQELAGQALEQHQQQKARCSQKHELSDSTGALLRGSLSLTMATSRNASQHHMHARRQWMPRPWAQRLRSGMNRQVRSIRNLWSKPSGVAEARAVERLHFFAGVQHAQKWGLQSLTRLVSVTSSGLQRRC